jgi:hypothetical protein
LVALDTFKLPPEKNIAVVFGNEVTGVLQKKRK